MKMTDHTNGIVSCGQRVMNAMRPIIPNQTRIITPIVFQLSFFMI